MIKHIELIQLIWLTDPLRIKNTVVRYLKISKLKPTINDINQEFHLSGNMRDHDC